MGHLITVELFLSQLDKAIIEKYRICVPEICVNAVVDTLKAHRDVEISTRFNDDKKVAAMLQKENDALREALDRKCQPLITIGVRKSFR